MLRRSIFAAILCALAGCQDYNFNPVGKCVIQPGSSRITLSSASTADVLFVVDDSGSMDPMQDNLRDNFGAFISQLAQAQADRKNQGLDPFEFHIAITTSSVYENLGVTTCGQFVAGQCRVPARAGHAQYDYPCSQSGAPCGDYVTSFYDVGKNCTQGIATEGGAYPQGNFVALGSNSKVLHFTKELKWETWNPTTNSSSDAVLQQRIDQFKQNVKVGSCGSGQEQHLESARLAVEKALQTNGLKQPADVSPSDWPHPGAKMVVVWLGNEDDCSNPATGRGDSSGGDGSIVLTGSPGNDACTLAESSTPATDTVGKLFPVDDYVSYFVTGLGGRSFGAAFIYSAVADTAAAGGFSAGTCPAACVNAEPNPTCVGRSAGTRFQNLARKLRENNVDTVEDSVCDANFGSTLQKIANLVVPVNALTLPSQPADTDVAALRIENSDGSTKKFCAGPGSATPDWNFVNCKSGQALQPSEGTSNCIAINHATKNCEANPGETYVAQYLGLVPQPDAKNLTNPQGGCAAVSDCTAALGGADKDWSCLVTGGARGTCVCQQSN